MVAKSHGHVKYMGAIGLLLLMLVCVRLPSLNRPLSKHHELNTAMVLINTLRWQQDGGGFQYAFTPMMNYAGPANKIYEKGPWIDAHHNAVYLSFGAGWMVMPYAFFCLTSLPPTPLGLQIFNLILGLFTIVLLFRLLSQMAGSKAAWAGTLLFAFLPAPLWYMGNGYVTTAAMLPLVIWFVYLWYLLASKAASHSKIKTIHYLALLACGVCLIYFDWMGVFLLAGLGAWAWWGSHKLPHRRWLATWCVLVALLGVLLVFGQFASYLGWPQVWQYWQSRSGERTMQALEVGWIHSVARFLLNMATGYLPLLLAAACAWRLPNTSNPQSPQTWIYWMLAAIALYHITLFNWSAEHEFAFLGSSLACTASIALTKGNCFAQKRRLILFLGLLGIFMFFVINRPGSRSWRGHSYNADLELGKQIKNAAPDSAVLFTNATNEIIAAYYAGRSLNEAVSPTSAKTLCDSLQIPLAWWLHIQDKKLIGRQRIVP